MKAVVYRRARTFEALLLSREIGRQPIERGRGEIVDGGWPGR
ncbi:hypothetical protein ACFPIJ_11105 [Dactylosporangium cerinum]|uniref:Uncharacterized protein n=1 Tax=Dactylosporangium cerinum TaxID=1434730 RepID=A0ABV9VTX4_9ACTN